MTPFALFSRRWYWVVFRWDKESYPEQLLSGAYLRAEPAGRMCLPEGRGSAHKKNTCSSFCQPQKSQETVLRHVLWFHDYLLTNSHSNSLGMCEKGRPQTERAVMLFCELYVCIRRKWSAGYHSCLLNFLLSSLSTCHTYISISLASLIRLFSPHCLLKLLSTINSDILRTVSKETNPTEFGTDLSIPLPCAPHYTCRILP